MKKILTIITILITYFNYAQCSELKTNNRPDGNVIKYFNPKPLIKLSTYEAGASVYHNITTDKYYISIVILFKTLAQDDVSGSLTIQLKNTNNSISLKLIESNKTKMNGKDVCIAMYELDNKSLELLKKNQLKSVFFKIKSITHGNTITENNNLFINQLKCLN